MVSAMITLIKKFNIKVRYLLNVLTQSHVAHKPVPTEHMAQLRKVQNYDQLFSFLDKYCNYLTYDLLDKLILQLSYRYYSFQSIKTQIQAYKKEVRLFKKSTTLKIFCGGHINIRYVHPRIRKHVKSYNWPKNVTLESVEGFRQRHSLTHSLERCAMIVCQVLNE